MHLPYPQPPHTHLIWSPEVILDKKRVKLLIKCFPPVPWHPPSPMPISVYNITSAHPNNHEHSFRSSWRPSEDSNTAHAEWSPKRLSRPGRSESLYRATPGAIKLSIPLRNKQSAMNFGAHSANLLPDVWAILATRTYASRLSAKTVITLNYRKYL